MGAVKKEKDTLLLLFESVRVCENGHSSAVAEEVRIFARQNEE